MRPFSLEMWMKEHGNLFRLHTSAWCKPSTQWSLVFDTENWETSFRNTPKLMDSPLFEAIVGTGSTNFSTQPPTSHTMPKIKQLAWWSRAMCLQLSQWFVKVAGRMRPGQMAGPRWRGTGSGPHSLSTPCWSRTLAVRFSPGDSIALDRISCPSFNFCQDAYHTNTISYCAFYWKYGNEVFFFLNHSFCFDCG